jgi:pyruvate/2-oxoglutarate dehydrogenase complex dihydrolipoamide dehydrogenase (E3) component
VAGTARPSARTPIEGVYLAGDWVGDEGMLSDAALASARAASKTILAGA